MERYEQEMKTNWMTETINKKILFNVLYFIVENG